MLLANGNNVFLSIHLNPGKCNKNSNLSFMCFAPVAWYAFMHAK